MVTDRLKRLREEHPEPTQEQKEMLLATILMIYGYIGLIGWMFFLVGVI